MISLETEFHADRSYYQTRRPVIEFVPCRTWLWQIALVLFVLASAGSLILVTPAEAGVTPIKLNGALASGGDVSFFFEISPDTSHVVYHADQDTDGVDELFSVPLDGSSAPTKLNGALVSGGDVPFPFEISPDSSRVVYFADQDTDEVFELFSVLLAGTPEEATGDLIDDVESLFDAGTLTKEQRDGLIAKLNAALSSLARGNIRAACNQLQAFINQVNAFINDGTLTPAEGQELIDSANAIRTDLGC